MSYDIDDSDRINFFGVSPWFIASISYFPFNIHSPPLGKNPCSLTYVFLFMGKQTAWNEIGMVSSERAFNLSLYYNNLDFHFNFTYVVLISLYFLALIYLQSKSCT